MFLKRLLDLYRNRGQSNNQTLYINFKLLDETCPNPLNDDRDESFEKSIENRRRLKIGMKVSWITVAAGTIAAIITLALSVSTFPAIPLFAILIPVGIALTALAPAIMFVIRYYQINSGQSNNNTATLKLL